MQLQKPLVFFDLETTGVNVAKDRIVQIGAIKWSPSGEREEKNVIINPTIPIPLGASAVHGIYDKDVEDKPTFKQIAKSFATWLQGCDLAGYNSDNFDVPMLIAEFERVGVEFPESDTVFVDVLKIERLVNAHTLEATYQRYTGQPLEGAHDAMADIRATLAVLEKQLEKFEALPKVPAELDAFVRGDNVRVDFAGKLTMIEGEVCWAFGKHKGEPVAQTRGYAEWFLSKDFPSESKRHIRKILEEL